MHCVDRGFCHVLIGVILFCCVFVLPLRTEKYLTSGTHCNWFWSFLVPGSSWFHYVVVLQFALFMVLFLKHMVSLCICIGVSFVQGLVPSSTWFHYVFVLRVCFVHPFVPWSTWFHNVFVLEFVLFILLFSEARGLTVFVLEFILLMVLFSEARGFTMHMLCSSSWLVHWNTWFHYAFVMEFVLYILLSVCLKSLSFLLTWNTR